MSHHVELPSIDHEALDDVNAGVSASTAAATSSTSTQLTSALEGITGQIANLGQNKNASNGSLESMLPMMLMMGMGGGGGACPCGCGMANCRRR